MSLVFLGLLLGLATSPAEVRQEPVPETAAAPEDADAPWIEWSGSLRHALLAKDVAAYNRLIDASAIIDRAFLGVECPHEFAVGFKAGVRSTFTRGEGYYSKLTKALAEGAHFDFLRLRENRTVPKALFRFAPADGGVDYWEFSLERKEHGGVRAIDIELATSGEPYSATIRRWMLPQAAEADKGLVQRLFGKDPALVTHWETVERIIGAAERKDLETFAKLVDGLPEELKADKTLILIRISTFPVDDPRRLEAVGDLRRHHPDDPCTRVNSIDYFWLRGDHAKAYEEIEHLREWAGGDPYLHLLRAQLLLGEENYEMAGLAARQAIDEGLGWVKPYWTLVAVSLHLERYEETLAILREMDRTFKMKWNDMTETPLYSGFVKSPQHAEWLEYLRTKPESR